MANDQNTEGAQKMVVQATTLPPLHIYVSSQGPALPRAQHGTEVCGGGRTSPSAFPLVMCIIRGPSSLVALESYVLCLLRC